MLLEGAGLAHPFIGLEPDPVPGPCREPLAEPSGAGAQADPTQAEAELWLQSCSFWGWFQQCSILIFISRINLWSYFPFLPPPLPLLPALFKEFDHFSQELGTINIPSQRV